MKENILQEIGLMHLAVGQCLEEIVECFLYKDNYWVITNLMEIDLQKILTAS
jgi:hypothetical protein